MDRYAIKRYRAVSLLSVLAALSLLGCNRMADSDANYLKALNKYYSSHPSCLWRDPVTFPFQQDAVNTRSAAAFDALVQQSLLTRATAEENATNGVRKQVNTYDLSSKGRSEWVADSKDPGTGNFCYGHRVATAIQSFTPTTSSAGATTTVVYRYTITDVPEWAKAAEVQAGFPSLQADLTGRQVGRATLTDTRKGWEISSAPWAHIDDSDIYR